MAEKGRRAITLPAVLEVSLLNEETSEIVEKKLGPKGRCITFKDRAVCEEPTPAEKRTGFCLADEEAREIGRLGKILEAHFGVPKIPSRL